MSEWIKYKDRKPETKNKYLVLLDACMADGLKISYFDNHNFDIPFVEYWQELPAMPPSYCSKIWGIMTRE